MNPPRAQLLHLTGPFRGRTITYPQSHLVVGTEPEAQIRFPPQSPVSPQHAELNCLGDSRCYTLKALQGPIFVNDREVRETPLREGDLIQVGPGGPKARFRVYEGRGAPWKPMRRILADARDVRVASGLAPGTSALLRDLITQSSWRLKIGLPLAILAVVFATSWLGGWLGGRRAARRSSAELQAQNRVLQAEVVKLRTQIVAYRREHAAAVSPKEVEKLRSELAGYAAVAAESASEDAALRRVLEVYSRGVGLIHGVFTLYHLQDGQREQVTGAGGDPLLLEYVGSGFLASAEGHVLTNRHVAEPWWHNPTVAPLIQVGLVPGFVSLSITFPGKDPIAVDPATIRLGPDEVDIGVLEVEVEGIPILPLDAGNASELRGDRVVLLGYPTGLNALLARAERELAEEVVQAATDTTSLIAELARRGAVAPIITQGALNEVKPRRLVYDAATTTGGSGGPVFGARGEVIGINFAVTRDFDASNFGVPIAFALPLLP